MTNINEILKQMEQKELTPEQKREMAVDRFFNTFGPAIRKKILEKKGVKTK